MRRFLLTFFIIFSLYNFSNAQGVDCANADPFCTGTTYNFPASTNVPDWGSVSCLGSTPNPAWYYLQIANPGNLEINMLGGNSSNDIDFICWGPFPNLPAACNGLTGGVGGVSHHASGSGGGYPSGNVIDCSYDSSPQEWCYIPNAITGQIYMLLITNFSNSACNIVFSQVSGPGTTDCSILAPPITGDTVCIGETINFTVNNPTPGATYSWTGPGGFTSNVMNPTIPNATTAMSGIYSMTITVGGQTSQPVTCNVLVNPNPTITVSPPNPSACAGSSVVLTGVCSTGTGWYVWSNGSQGSGPITVTPSATTTYTVTGTDQNGCSGTASVTVTIASNLTITATATPSTICIGQSSVISAVGGTTYTWEPGTLTGDSVSVTPSATTTYSVSASDGNGCTGATTVTVNVILALVIGVSPNPADICLGESINLTANGANAYTWEPGTLSGGTVTVSPAVNTTYTVTGDINGCTGSTTVTVSVASNPDLAIGADIYEGCEDLRVQFTDLSTVPNNSWYWDFGDNSFSYIQNPTHLYTEAGTYDVSLTVNSSSSCSATITWPAMITVYPRPYAYFTPLPDIVSELDPTVFFDDQSIGANGWNWYFGDTNYMNNNSNFENPIHTYSDTGTYTITLVAITNHGCTDTTDHNIYVEPNISFYIPNAFTPNDDGKNTNFTGKGEGINWSTYEMRIYDRWGRIICYTQDYEAGWDGTSKGKKLSAGVYTYTISFIDIKFKEHKYKGTVVLVK